MAVLYCLLKKYWIIKLRHQLEHWKDHMMTANLEPMPGLVQTEEPPAGWINTKYTWKRMYCSYYPAQAHIKQPWPSRCEWSVMKFRIWMNHFSGIINYCMIWYAHTIRTQTKEWLLIKYTTMIIWQCDKQSVTAVPTSEDGSSHLVWLLLRTGM